MAHIDTETPAVPTLLFNGRIHTMQPHQGSYEAVLLEGGRVRAVGSAEELRNAGLPDRTDEIDLAGHSVMPGLVDTHPHVLHKAIADAVTVDISDAVDHAEISERIARRAADLPAGTWILTTPVGDRRFYVQRTYRDLPERVLPNRDVLDRAAPEHPVVIQAVAPRTPNVCSMNTRALEALGLNDQLPERISDVWIEKDFSGRLTGRFHGSVHFDHGGDPYWAQVIARIPQPVLSEESRKRILQEALVEQNALGVTTIYEPHYMTVEQLALYRSLHAEGGLTVRVGGALDAEIRHALRQPLSVDAYLEQLESTRQHLHSGDEWLRFDSLSMATEGGMLWMGLGQWPEPYLDAYGRETRGRDFPGAEKIQAFARFCVEHEVRANFIQSGDAAQLLGMLEAPEFAESARRRSWMIIHAPIATPDAIARYAALGLSATTCVGFTWAQAEVFSRRFGEQVLRDATPVARWLEAGVPTAHSTDWGPSRPFQHMQLSERMEFAESGRRSDLDVHRLDRRQALEAWTIMGANVLQWEGIGTLSEGSYADLIVLDRDPFECSVDEVGELAPMMTFSGGRLVHDQR